MKMLTKSNKPGRIEFPFLVKRRERTVNYLYYLDLSNDI